MVWQAGVHTGNFLPHKLDEMMGNLYLILISQQQLVTVFPRSFLGHLHPDAVTEKVIEMIRD